MIYFWQFLLFLVGFLSGYWVAEQALGIDNKKIKISIVIFFGVIFVLGETGTAHQNEQYD